MIPVQLRLASTLTNKGEYETSEQHFLAAIPVPLLSIAYAELKRGQAANSEQASRRAREIFEIALPGSFLVGVASCLTGLALEQQGATEEGAAMVEASHALMLTGSIPVPYPELCRLDPGSG